MNDKKLISASEIGFYTFCPRAWALQQLDYESDNQWEMEAGKEFHRIIGEQELEKESETREKRIRSQRISHLLTVLTVIVLLCLIFIMIRIVLK